jgi:hypothetical protein
VGALNGAPSPDRTLLKGHKTLPRRRQPEPTSDLFDGASPIEFFKDDKVHDVHVPVTPTLPLTPPNQTQDDVIHQDSSPRLNGRHSLPLSHTSTGSRQFSPPTPDVTPPRIRDATPKARPAFASLQSSMSSRAESFQTARENISDDDVVESLYPSTHSLVLRKRQKSFPEPSPLSNGFESIDDSTEEKTPTKKASTPKRSTNIVHENGDKACTRVLSPSPLPKSRANGTPTQNHQDVSGLDRESAHAASPQPMNVDKPGEKSASDLTDNEQKLMDRVNTWRYSGGSFTSTIEAMVIETSPPKQRTLRHTEKRTSLRSVSSPQAQSTRTSTESNADSPHRLIHKPARISNQNRNSTASDMSIPFSTTSSYHPQKMEVIPVAVVPQRRSSLKSSAPNSRAQSHARSATSTQRNKSVSRSRASDKNPTRRKRTISDSAGSRAGGTKEPRGREVVSRPPIPARSSSLSAPTSRNNSRATSLTSESLRRHTEAMELAIEVPKNNENSALLPSPRIVLPDGSDSRNTEALVPASPQRFKDDIELLHAPSLHFTQSSVVSSSPGPVEIREATMVTYFPHNNESLLVINSYMQQESQVVQALHGQNFNGPVAVWTPQQSTAAIDIESPLRNPRTPPVPPTQKAVFPVPGNYTTVTANGHAGNPDLSRQGSNRSNRLSRGFGSVKRALSARRNSDSTRQQPVTRSLSTRSAKNRRDEKARDSQLYSFWRPRGFWDDFDSSPANEGGPATPAIQNGRPKNDEDEFVSNSLGLPQKRVIFSGPLVLARRLSKRSKKWSRRRRHGASHSDLNLAMGMGIVRPHSPYQRRTAKFRLQRGVLFPVRVLRSARLRAKETRQRRASAKLEARREKLKQSIGAKTLTDPYSVGPFSHGAPYEESHATAGDRGLYRDSLAEVML